MTKPQFHGYLNPVHPCREIPTRHCPAAYEATCDSRPCARFESTDERPWLDEMRALKAQHDRETAEWEAARRAEAQRRRTSADPTERALQAARDGDPYWRELRKLSTYAVISQEVLDDHKATREAIAANRARRAAMTQAERDAEDAAWEAQRAAEKAARTCQHCGCDPDEHGGY